VQTQTQSGFDETRVTPILCTLPPTRDRTAAPGLVPAWSSSDPTGYGRRCNARREKKRSHTRWAAHAAQTCRGGQSLVANFPKLDPRFTEVAVSLVEDAGCNFVEDTRKADKRDDGKDADPIREAHGLRLRYCGERSRSRGLAQPAFRSINVPGDLRGRRERRPSAKITLRNGDRIIDKSRRRTIKTGRMPARQREKRPGGGASGQRLGNPTWRL
jgi:hypothetical protein